MTRRVRPQSEFDRWLGYRIYPYYLFSWIVFMIYAMIAISEGNAHLGVIIGFPLFFLIFLSLVGTDYIAFRVFCIYQDEIKWRNEK